MRKKIAHAGSTARTMVNISMEAAKLPLNRFMMNWLHFRVFSFTQTRSVPVSNAFVERIFSVMGNVWTDERNRLAVNTVKNNRRVRQQMKSSKNISRGAAKIAEDGDYSADQVFNADETGLYWKKLPNRTYIAKDEKTASGHKSK
ncbi:hypothetical protein TNCV_2129441 [Trichonephila clavipes]|nr:hypothetical protein TNCV_2129441 [Trichonephila clavipes]